MSSIAPTVRQRLWDSPCIRSDFGGRAIELAGISVRSEYQKHDAGTQLVGSYIDVYHPEEVTAYTRNPSLVRLLERTTRREDILRHDNPEEVAATLDYATVGPDGHLYHIGRYGPDGLYGSYDPAVRPYGAVALMDQCILLQDKNNALAVSVSLRGDK